MRPDVGHCRTYKIDEKIIGCNWAYVRKDHINRMIWWNNIRNKRERKREKGLGMGFIRCLQISWLYCPRMYKISCVHRRYATCCICQAHKSFYPRIFEQFRDHRMPLYTVRLDILRSSFLLCMSCYTYPIQYVRLCKSLVAIISFMMDIKHLTVSIYNSSSLAI